MRKLLLSIAALALIIAASFQASAWFNVGMVGGGVPAAGYTNYTADGSMVSYYMMEQATAANALDGTGNNTLTRVSDGSTPTQSSDHQQGSYSADLVVGTSDVYSLADASLSASFPGKDTGGNQGSFSVGAWIKMDESNSRGLFRKNSVGDEGSWGLLFDATNFKFVVYSNGYSTTQVVGGTAITDDGSTWYHVVGVFDTDLDLIYIYVNGASDASAVSCTSATFLGTSPLMIGPFDGHIDEAFIMSRALSSTEVAEIYNHGLAGDR